MCGYVIIPEVKRDCALELKFHQSGISNDGPLVQAESFLGPKSVRKRLNQNDTGIYPAMWYLPCGPAVLGGFLSTS